MLTWNVNGLIIAYVMFLDARRSDSAKCLFTARFVCAIQLWCHPLFHIPTLINQSQSRTRQIALTIFVFTSIVHMNNMLCCPALMNFVIKMWYENNIEHLTGKTNQIIRYLIHILTFQIRPLYIKNIHFTITFSVS